MKPNTSLSRDDQGQAYTLEAVIATLLIVSVVLFIAPSLVTPTFQDETDSVAHANLVEQDVQDHLNARSLDGTLKSDMLNYNDGDDSFVGFTLPGEQFLVQHPDSEFGDGLERLEEKHNVQMNVILIPESDATAANPHDPERQFMVKKVSPGSPVTVASTTITLHNNDRLQSPARAHSHYGSAAPRTTGTQDRLEDTDNYLINEAADRPADTQVYNTVTVVVMIHEPSS